MTKKHGAEAESWADLLGDDDGTAEKVHLNVTDEEFSGEDVTQKIKMEAAARMNAIAEAIAAQIDQRKSVIGATEIAAVVVPLDSRDEIEDFLARVKITDTGGTPYYLDIRRDNKGIRDLFIPPSLNKLEDIIMGTFNHVREYGKVGPHEVTGKSGAVALDV